MATNYIGTKRRIRRIGNYVYDVIDQTNLNNAIPSDPLDAVVVMAFVGGRGVDDSGHPYVTMTVRAMLAETTPWRSVAVANQNDIPPTETHDNENPAVIL